MADEVDYYQPIMTKDLAQSKFEAQQYLQRFAIARWRREQYKELNGFYPPSAGIPSIPQGVVLKNVVNGRYGLVKRLADPRTGKRQNGDLEWVTDYTTGDWKVVKNWSNENRPEDFPDIGGVAQTVDANLGLNRWDG